MVRRGKAWTSCKQTLSLQHVSGVTGWQRPIQNRPMEQGATQACAVGSNFVNSIRGAACARFYRPLALLTGYNCHGTVG